MTKWKLVGGPLFLLCAATVSPAQVYTTMASFNCANGCFPGYVSLVQGLDGKLYGTTKGGLTNQPGTTFKIVPGGNTVITVDTFWCACKAAAKPDTGLALDTDGNFYGTTAGFDDYVNGGTVFRMGAKGKLTTLHRFRTFDGEGPYAALLLAADGTFYGTTYYGGSSRTCKSGCGTVFKITPEGTFTTLHSFASTDGAGPVGKLVQGTDGNFYGTTEYGGSGPCVTLSQYVGCGTVFRMTQDGVLTTLHEFNLIFDDALPLGAMVQATDGNFYGTTSGADTICQCNSYGTVFRMTPAGRLTSLHRFNGYDGDTPYGGLIQATDGNFYGTTSSGGANFPGGTIFKITPGGTLTTLYGFCALARCADGNAPVGALVQSTDGIFYGVTGLGGYFYEGVIFSLDVGLGPFVTFARSAGKVGETGPVLGQGLTGTTSVAINGIQADFTVVADTYIRVTVPAGATTGYVTVTTPSGTLTSNVPFRVIP